MPYPTIKPLFVALFMTLMFAQPAVDPRGQAEGRDRGVILCAATMTAFLYVAGS